LFAETQAVRAGGSRVRAVVLATFILTGTAPAALVDPPRLVVPFSVSGDSVTVVPVLITSSHSFGADLAFLIDTTVARPDRDFIRAHAFESEPSSLCLWNAVGDTVFVSVSSPHPRDLSDVPLVELAFRGKRDVPSGSATALTLLPYPFSTFNEHGLSVAASDKSTTPHFSLSAAPNPFNSATAIRTSVPCTAAARLTVYATDGRAVRTLTPTAAAGMHTFVWDGRDEAGCRVASGVYLCRLEASHQTSVIRVTVIR